jgi:hypothetical protein
MNPTRAFASGQPILDVVQTDRSPKRVFVLGVYASAVHARWVENHRQEKALRREKVPIPPLWPRVPTRLADDTRRAQILEELQTSQATVLITLGDQPLQWFAAHFGAKPRLADYGEDGATYGQLHPIQLPGRTIQLLPLAHPRQIARLGAHSEEWAALHETWVTTAKPSLP